MANTEMSQGIYIESGVASAILDTALVSVTTDSDVQESVQTTSNLKEDLCIMDQPVLSINQAFGNKLGATELDRIGEGENKKLRGDAFSPKKGFKIKEWSNKKVIGYLAAQYLKNSKTLAGANTDVQTEMMDLYDQSKDFIISTSLTKQYEIVKLLVLGNIMTNAYGSGSPTPNAQPLFSGSHPYLNGTMTFSNTSTNPLTDANLQIALNQLKTGVRLQNGKFPKVAKEYLLCVSTSQAVVARNILQTTGNAVGQLAGLGTSANRSWIINTFSYKGNTVRIVELPQLGEIQNDGTTLWNVYNWFVINPEVIKWLKAFKAFELYPTKLKSYDNPDTDDIYVSVRTSFAVDHYNAEAGVYGSFATS